MDLLFIGLLSLVTVPLALGTDADTLRVVLGAPVVLFVPGYVLVAALFPRRGRLSPVELAALSVGLSIALIPLLGLALQFTPYGLASESIVGVLALWAWGGCAAAWLRRRRLPAEDRAGLSLTAARAWLRRPEATGDLAAAGVALVAVVLALGFASWRLLQPTPVQPFTEFYILGPGGRIDDYPTTLWVGETGEVIAGIVNREGDAQTYSVRALLGDEEVGGAGPVTLGDQEGWESLLTLTPSRASGTLPLEFRLFRDSGGSPYQTIRLYVNVRES